MSFLLYSFIERFFYSLYWLCIIKNGYLKMKMKQDFFFIVLNIFTIAFLFTVGYQNNSLTALACSRAHVIPNLFQISVLKGETIKSLLKVWYIQNVILINTLSPFIILFYFLSIVYWRILGISHKYYKLCAQVPSKWSSSNWLHEHLMDALWYGKVNITKLYILSYEI